MGVELRDRHVQGVADRRERPSAYGVRVSAAAVVYREDWVLHAACLCVCPCASVRPHGRRAAAEGQDQPSCHRPRMRDDPAAMRLATLIIGLVLAVATGVQSCAVAYTSNVATELGRQAGQRTTETSTLSAGGAFGMLGALAWLVAAALVMARPRISTWIFGLSSLAWIAARVNGFSDAGVWIIVSLVLAVMARAAEREKLKAEIAAATTPSVSLPSASPAALPPAGWYQDPDGVGGRRWWDGAQWTEHRDAAPIAHEGRGAGFEKHG